MRPAAGARLGTVPQQHSQDKAPVRLLIADGQHLTTLRNMVDLHSQGVDLVDIVSNENELLASTARLSADVFMVDLELPDRGGIQIGSQLMSMNPAAKVLVMAAVLHADAVRNAMKAGLHGVLTSDIEIGTFVNAISCVLDGMAVLPSAAVVAAVDRSPEERMASSRARALTQREREILGLLVEGLRGDGIASRLTLSNHTVRTHLYNLFRKLEVHSRAEAIGYAIRYDLIDTAGERSIEREAQAAIQGGAGA